MQKKTKVLLLKDVRNVGRMGEIASVRAGFARNFLLPFGHADIVSAKAYRIQVKLQEERAKVAASDKVEAEKLAVELKDVVLKTVTKVDIAGHMYGSVSSQDVAKMLVEHGYQIERRDVMLPHAIKKLGVHKVEVRLKEGVIALVQVEVLPDRVIHVAAKEQKQEVQAEEVSQEETPAQE